MVETEYDHIWDCCCDHGQLGAALLKTQIAKQAITPAQIHFVDIVPELMDTVASNIKRFLPNTESLWQIHCLDVALLPLDQYQGKHLIIIAGVGGDLMMHFINAIHQQYPTLELDFILCPVHHQFALRQQLIQFNFGLKQEVLIKENNRFYEILYVTSSQHKGTNVSPIGDQIWHASSVAQAEIIQQYLTKTLSHYQRIAQGTPAQVEHIIQAYETVTL